MPTKLVTPEEWVSRTSVTFGRRTASTVKCDEAYRAYYRDQSEKNRQALWEALEAYLVEKGGNWENVHRNQNSGGLMAQMHALTAPKTQQGITATQHDKMLLEERIPETRHGVLYLWEATTVETQWGAILLEGGLSVASSGISLGQELHGLDPSSDWNYAYTGGSGLTTGGSLVTGYVRGRSTADAVPPKPTKVPPPPPRPLVRTVAKRDLTINEVETQPSSWAAAKTALGAFFEQVWKAIKDAVQWIWNKIVTNQGVVISTAGVIIEKIVIKVVEEVAKAAVPFVKAGIDLGRGVMETVKGICERLDAYFLRQKFVVRPGHFTDIANAIETQMNWAIGKGLYKVIKGGASLGLTFVTAGASAIVDAIAAGIEFATKIIMRMVEGRAIQKFLDKVKETYKTKETGSAGRPAIVYNDEAFNALFAEGCDASACIPMMTINSGIAGDLMMFMKMFDDTRSAKMVVQQQFDAGTEYFQKLKQFGRDYVSSSGFRFSSAKKDVQGYLNHAVVHHTPDNISARDAVLTLLS